MAPIVGAAAIAGGASVVGSLINAASTSHTNDQQYSYNKQLSELAYKQNIQAWNMQNMYNSPAAQMQRLRAAGLNPNLLYGNGEAATGLAGDAPQLQYGSYNPKVPAFGDALTNGINAALSSQQANAMSLNAEANMLRASADAAYKTKQTDWYDTIQDSLMEQRNFQNIYLQIQGGYTSALTDAAEANVAKIWAEHSGQQIQNAFDLTKLKYADDYFRLANDLTAAEINNVLEETKDHAVLRAKYFAEIQNYLANVKFLATAGNLNNQRAMESGQNMYESLARIDKFEKELKLHAGLTEAQINALKGSAARQWIQTSGAFVRDVGSGVSAILGVPQFNLNQPMPGGNAYGMSLYPSQEHNPWMVEY